MSARFDRTNMFEPLLQADPTFRGTWEDFLAEWHEEEEKPLYFALSALSRHLIQKLETGDTERFDAVFDIVEHWHIDGDPFVREAATIGLLENLQNGNLHSTTEPVAFEPWLRPCSARWWDYLNAFWRGEQPAAPIWPKL